jgi:hypothetical protein
MSLKYYSLRNPTQSQFATIATYSTAKEPVVAYTKEYRYASDAPKKKTGIQQGSPIANPKPTFRSRCSPKTFLHPGPASISPNQPRPSTADVMTFGRPLGNIKNTPKLHTSYDICNVQKSETKLTSQLNPIALHNHETPT